MKPMMVVKTRTHSHRSDWGKKAWKDERVAMMLMKVDWVGAGYGIGEEP